MIFGNGTVIVYVSAFLVSLLIPIGLSLASCEETCCSNFGGQEGPCVGACNTTCLDGVLLCWDCCDLMFPDPEDVAACIIICDLGDMPCDCSC